MILDLSFTSCSVASQIVLSYGLNLYLDALHGQIPCEGYSLFITVLCYIMIPTHIVRLLYTILLCILNVQCELELECNLFGHLYIASEHCLKSYIFC